MSAHTARERGGFGLIFRNTLPRASAAIIRKFTDARPFTRENRVKKFNALFPQSAWKFAYTISPIYTCLYCYKTYPVPLLRVNSKLIILNTVYAFVLLFSHPPSSQTIHPTTPFSKVFQPTTGRSNSCRVCFQRIF